jgi:hypothetical protein
MTLSRLVTGALVWWCALACNSQKPPPPGEAPVFGEHRHAITGAATGQVGEDCTESGASGCLSGLCLHAGLAQTAGYLCSKACQDREDCPPEWSCTQLHPSEAARTCIPLSP